MIKSTIKKELIDYYDFVKSEIDIKSQEILCNNKVLDNQKERFLDIYNEMINQCEVLFEKNIEEINNFFDENNQNHKILKDDKEEIKVNVLTGYCSFLRSDLLKDNLSAKNKIGILFITDWYLDQNQINYLKIYFQKAKNDLKYIYDDKVLKLTHGLSNVNQIENIIRLSKSNIMNETSISMDLSFEAKFIVKIAKSTFKCMPSISELRLRRFKNVINENIDLDIEEGSFNELSNLETMEMFNIHLNSMNEHTLAGLNNLILLKLSCCQLDNINGKNLFKSLNNLVELDLSFNNIQSIDKTVFANLVNLKYLFLNNNVNLNSIELSAFDSLIRLESLDMSNCALNLNEEFLFRNLNNLKELNLSYNRMESIKNNTFIGLANLQVLNLAYRHNCIRSIQPNSFESMKNLVNLFISGSESILNKLDQIDCLKKTEICKKVYSK